MSAEKLLDLAERFVVAIERIAVAQEEANAQSRQMHEHAQATVARFGDQFEAMGAAAGAAAVGNPQLAELFAPPKPKKDTGS